MRIVWEASAGTRVATTESGRKSWPTPQDRIYEEGNYGRRDENEMQRNSNRTTSRKRYKPESQQKFKKEINMMELEIR